MPLGPRRLALLVALLATAVNAQLPPDQAVKAFETAPGLEMQLWASESLFANPTSIDVDPQGRVWVCEAVNYRQILRGKPVLRPEGDRILILEDKAGTGKADTVTVFAQSPALQAPLGICVLKLPTGPGYRVYVCQSPDILVFDDLDGDGKADGPPRKLLSGFGGIDHDHGVHGITIGPDGRLLFSVGDQGVKGLVDRDGKTWTTNKTDCQAGTIWRCDLDGKNLELVAHNFRNQYKPCMDSSGNIFVSDNDDDGNQQTRICYVMPGGNYGYWPRGPGQSHWHEEQPGVVPKILRTYFGSPTGMCVYEGTLLPEKYRGKLLHADAGPRQLRCYHQRPDGAGFAVDREDIVTSSDNWFRPSDMVVAPDGSVMVADWYDPGVGGHGMGDTTRGRIYRLAPKGYVPKRPPLANFEMGSDAVIADALLSPSASQRGMAFAAVHKLPTDLAAQVVDHLTWRKDSRSAAMAGWVRAHHAGGKRRDADAARAEGPMSPAVARDLLVSLRNVQATDARGPILKLAKLYDGQDRFLLAAIGIAVGSDPARRATILADFDKEFPDWNEATTNLIFELRPPSVMPRLEKLLADLTVAAAQRAKIAEIVATSDDPTKGLLLLERADAEPDAELRSKLLAAVTPFLAGKWKALNGDATVARLVDRWSKEPKTQADAVTLVAAFGDGKRLPFVKAIAADSAAAPATRVAAVKALGNFHTPESVAALIEFGQAGPQQAEALAALATALDTRKNAAVQSAALKHLSDAVRSAGPLRGPAAAAMATSRGGSEWLLNAHDKQQLPADVLEATGRALRASPYPDLRNRALIAFPTAAKLDLAKLPPPAKLAERRGDAKRGEKLLLASATSDMQCLKCHQIKGQGGQVGPDLSAIGSKASRENLFESILYPSKAIADQYIQWQLVTDDGLTFAGLIMAETPQAVTIRDAAGKDTVIPVGKIDTRSKSLVSLMPQELMKAFTEADLVDVVEYLTTLTQPAPAGKP